MPDKDIYGGLTTTKATKKGLSNIKRQAASYNLDQIVRAGQQDKDYKGGISSADRVIADMSKKNQDFINRNRRKDGSLNSAALALLNSRWDERSDYQRDLNKFIKSSPEAKDAYLERFPVGGRINLGIPAAFNALSNLAIPAPIRALGTIVRDVAGLGGRGLKALGHLAPKGMIKDFGAEGRRLLSNFPRLTNEQDKLLNIQIEEGKGKDVDIKEQIEKGFQLDPSWQDEMVKESGLDSTDKTKDKELAEAILFGVGEKDTSQDIAYDPEKDIEFGEYGKDIFWKFNAPGGSKAYETEDWLGDVQPLIDESGALDQTDLTQEDIFDVSQNVMPHVPITQEQKKKIIADTYGFTEDDDSWVNQMYERAREQQGKGLEYLPWEGVVAEDDSYEWQRPGTSEIQDQIRWNTANQPLGTNLWQPPELNEELIQENLKTGSDLWDFWDVGQQAEGGYLKKYDDGGYANMSTFEKLKAINDSIAED